MLPRTRKQYGQNETYYPESLPDAVVYPKDEQEVSDILSLCNTNLCPVVPWGTGTSLEGNSVPIAGGITLSFENNQTYNINFDVSNSLSSVVGGTDEPVNGMLPTRVFEKPDGEIDFSIFD